MPSKASARSASPARSASSGQSKKGASSFDLVSADTAILVCAGYFTCLFVAMLISPADLITLYDVPLDELQKDTKAYVGVLVAFQFWALWNLGFFMSHWAVRRVGSDKSKSLMCFSNAICLTYIAIHAEVVLFPMLKDLQMPEFGLNYTRAVSTVMIVLSILGWMAAGKATPNFSLVLKPTASPVATAACYHIVLNLVFGMVMSSEAGMEVLFAQYKFQAEGVFKKWIYMVYTGIGQVLIMNVIQTVCLLSVEKKETAASINRGLWAFYCMVFTCNCFNNTIFLKYVQPDMPAGGQYFNLGLWFIGIALFQRAMTGSLPFLK